MSKIHFTFLLIILSSIFVDLSAQITENDLKSAYLIKVADDFDWKNSSEKIKIGVFGNNKQFLTTLSGYSKNKTIGGKTIEVISISSSKEGVDCNIIFIAFDKHKQAERIINSLEGKKVLVFTDQAPTLEHSMINFIANFENKLKFKINSSLLNKHGFYPSNLLLILGGSDTDVFSLFEKKDASLLFEKSKTIQLKEENSKKEKELLNLQEKLKASKSAINEKEIEIAEKTLEVENTIGKLNLQKEFLKDISKKINETSIELDKKEKEIARQEDKLKKQTEIFDIQNNEIELRNSKIKEQDNILAQQENLLNIKQQYLNYAYIFSVILLGILIFAVISFLGKQKSSKKLATQNTKLQQALDELQTAQAKLVQNEKMASLGMVTAGMAHEINNPMTFVYTGTSILKAEIDRYNNIIENILQTQSNSTEQIKLDSKEYIETKKSIEQTIQDIELGSKRVTEIVDSLQNFSRLNENDVKTIDINESINSTLTILGSHAREKLVTITKQYAEESIKVECFPASINQVFVNLLTNAIDACPNNGGEININVYQNEKSCFIEVEDNGYGISKSNISKIFDPFFTTKGIGKGTGLGLSISYNIIKKHNGNISVESEQNNKTVFKLEIPLKYTHSKND